jgi:hypothetical protein
MLKFDELVRTDRKSQKMEVVSDYEIVVSRSVVSGGILCKLRIWGRGSNLFWRAKFHTTQNKTTNISDPRSRAASRVCVYIRW